MMAFLIILRPLNLIFVFVCVIAGAFFKADMPVISLQTLWASIVASLIAGGGYVINDFYDYKIDIINRPERILPSKKMKLSVAYKFGIILFLAGILLSFLLSPILIIISIINSIFLFLYAKSLKKSFLFGNFIVAYSASSTFIFGGLANDNFSHALIIAIFAFSLTLIREILKDLEDSKGDALYDANTLPITIGFKNTILFLYVLNISIFIVSVLLYKSLTIKTLTFSLLLIFIHIPMIISNFYFTFKKYKLRQYSHILKIEMLLLLILLNIGESI